MNEHKDEQAGGWTGGLMDRKTWINGCMDRSTDTWMTDEWVNGWVKRSEPMNGSSTARASENAFPACFLASDLPLNLRRTGRAVRSPRIAQCVPSRAPPRPAPPSPAGAPWPPRRTHPHSFYLSHLLQAAPGPQWFRLPPPEIYHQENQEHGARGPQPGARNHPRLLCKQPAGGSC